MSKILQFFLFFCIFYEVSTTGTCQNGTDEVLDPSGKFCYLIQNHRQTFFDGWKICNAYKTQWDLVKIENIIDNNFLWKLAETTGYYSNYYFIGASRPAEDVDFTWTDGTSLDFENWSKVDTDGNCLVMRLLDGKWQPFSCQDTIPFICYGPAS